MTPDDLAIARIDRAAKALADAITASHKTPRGAHRMLERAYGLLQTHTAQNLIDDVQAKEEAQVRAMVDGELRRIAAGEDLERGED